MHSDKNIYKIVETNDIGNFEEKTNKISKILTSHICCSSVAYILHSIFDLKQFNLKIQSTQKN